MPDNSLQKNSSAYRLPALDIDFLLGDSMRGVRLQLEYAKAEELLRAWIVRSTIVVFGSARVLPGGSGDADVSTATLPPRAVPRPGDQSARWYEQARRLDRKSTRLNSSHVESSYAVFCLKKKSGEVDERVAVALPGG